MAVTPVGGVIYANQNTPVVSSVQQQAQSRLDFQNMMSAQVAGADRAEIEQTRPAEANAKLNPDRDHEKQEADEREKERRKLIAEQEPQPPTEIRLLDIKA